jgi:hypothetical protein
MNCAWSEKICKQVQSYLINGCRFHTKILQNERATQNSGMCIEAQTLMHSISKYANPILHTTTFNGVIKEIIILDFFSEYTLFKCDRSMYTIRDRLKIIIWVLLRLICM